MNRRQKFCCAQKLFLAFVITDTHNFVWKQVSLELQTQKRSSVFFNLLLYGEICSRCRRAFHDITHPLLSQPAKKKFWWLWGKMQTHALQRLSTARHWSLEWRDGLWYHHLCLQWVPPTWVNRMWDRSSKELAVLLLLQRERARTRRARWEANLIMRILLTVSRKPLTHFEPLRCHPLILLVRPRGMWFNNRRQTAILNVGLYNLTQRCIYL